MADPGTAFGFCGLILARAAGLVAWIGAAPDVWPLGLTAFGLSPAEMVIVGARRPRDGLWAFEEAYLCHVLGRIAEHPVRVVHELLPWNIAEPQLRFDQRTAA